MISLYPDQSELIDSARAALGRTRSILIRSETGSGKTVITAFMFKAATDKGKTALFVVPRRELMRQTSNTFSEIGIKHSFVSAGMPFDPQAGCWIATTESLVRRLDCLPKIDMAVFDETHVGATSLDMIIQHCKAQGGYVIGLSATPCKLSGKGLGCWFDEMVNGKPMRWLIDNGRLSDYRIYAPNTPDLSSIPDVAGDFAKGKLADYMEKDAVLVGSAVSHYKQYAMGKLSVTFCTSRKHAAMTNDAFNEAGVPSAYVDGETPDEERKRIFKALARKEILNVCNCALLCFGFDLSSAAGEDVTIESLSILRPTKSLALWNQIVGRALRYKPYPALIFDHSGNVMRLGMPDEVRRWTLKDKKKSKDTDKPPPIRICPKCFYAHKTAKSCPDCGFVYPIEEREIEEVEGSLEEITAAKVKAARDKKKRRAACKTLEELIEFGRAEGYKFPEQWAKRFMEIRQRYRRGY